LKKEKIILGKTEEDDMKDIYASMNRARCGNQSLLEWAETTRDRKPVRLIKKSY
jgi:hypothetical protein